jgi:hypothetical protein
MEDLKNCFPSSQLFRSQLNKQLPSRLIVSQGKAGTEPNQAWLWAWEKKEIFVK